jgi:hypothetical protein
MYSYDARAIDGFADGDNYFDPTNIADDLHQEPGTILPSLDSGGVNSATIFVNGNTVTDTGLDRGVDAVSYVFMHDAIMNEYTTEAAVAAGTEWVITFPTKQFYVHQDFLDDYDDRLRPPANDPLNLVAPVDPFTSTWTWVDEVLNDDDTVKTEAFVDYPCEVVFLDNIYDREEDVPGPGPVGPDQPPIVSPAPPVIGPDGLASFSLCFETQVITFGADADGASPILGSANTINIDNDSLGYEYGWLRLDLTDASADTNQDGAIEEILRAPLGGLLGLPVTGFAVQQFENSFLGAGADVLANYGGIFSHKGTRMQSSGSD